MATLFDVLGVARTATDREIKKAYKEQALRHHPDKGGDAEVFKKVSEAYDILADEDHRESYVQLLNAGTHTTVLDQFVRNREAQAEKEGVAKPSSKYDRTCRMWARGKCTNPNCLYRHYKTADSDKVKVNKVCHDYLRGYCRFGAECQFRHPDEGAGAAGEASWVKHWVCNDVWSGCKASNHVLEHPKRCHQCGTKRKMAKCKYPPGTVAQLTGSHAEIVNAVAKKTLFFSRDGVYRKQMKKLVAKMQQLPLVGQMVPTVSFFYPSANCYHCVFQDENFLIVPEEYMKRGTEKWTCMQCKYQNPPGLAKCGLCGHKNPKPVEDWTPFIGTWKSTGGKYFLAIEDHSLTSSDPSHYYSEVGLADGRLSYKITLVEDDADDGGDSSDEEDGAAAAMPEPLGLVTLCRERDALRGSLRLASGDTQTTTFTKMQAEDLDSEASGSESSSFNSAESTPTRNARREKRKAEKKKTKAPAKAPAKPEPRPPSPDRRRSSRRTPSPRRDRGRRDRSYSRDRDRGDRRGGRRDRSLSPRRDRSRDRDRGRRDRSRSRDRDRGRRDDRGRYSDRYDRDRGRRSGDDYRERDRDRDRSGRSRR
eukprot:TRINITY_DN18510_c0_g1_i1.p1 TRINITY_DN18510_c0_g1~~TRINITY_DN18510_c0_g1_i1.p1  ORF type:complete len:592 (+),score=154.50 TRINITY_DN18510_c0_g1_i1:83-1858(+)